MAHPLSRGLARPLDLACAIKKVGAPFLAYFARVGYLDCRQHKALVPANPAT